MQSPHRVSSHISKARLSFFGRKKSSSSEKGFKGDVAPTKLERKLSAPCVELQTKKLLLLDNEPLFLATVIQGVKIKGGSYLTADEGEQVLVLHSTKIRKMNLLAKRGEQIGWLPAQTLNLDPHHWNPFRRGLEVLVDNSTHFLHLFRRMRQDEQLSCLVKELIETQLSDRAMVSLCQFEKAPLFRESTDFISLYHAVLKQTEEVRQFLERFKRQMKPALLASLAECLNKLNEVLDQELNHQQFPLTLIRLFQTLQNILIAHQLCTADKVSLHLRTLLFLRFLCPELQEQSNKSIESIKIMVKILGDAELDQEELQTHRQKFSLWMEKVLQQPLLPLPEQQKAPTPSAITIFRACQKCFGYSEDVKEVAFYKDLKRELGLTEDESVESLPGRIQAIEEYLHTVQNLSNESQQQVTVSASF